MRTSFRLELLCLSGLLLLLVPAPAPAQDNPTDEPQPMEDADARKLLRELDKSIKSKEPRLRMEAVKTLASHQNEQFIKPLAKLCKDKDVKVVEAAIGALGNQPFKKSQDALIKLVRNPRYAFDETLGPELMRSLGKVGWSKSHYEILRDLFDDADKKTKKAMFEMFAAQKEVRAFSLFADNLEEPRPANVNSPSNPPASYWKKRWEEWSYYKAVVRKGMTTLTGQSFATTKDAKEWAETKEARKAGFVYKRGS